MITPPLHLAQMLDLHMHHGAAVLFAWAFAVQLGVPPPAIPMLLGAGALAVGEGAVQ